MVLSAGRRNIFYFVTRETGGPNSDRGGTGTQRNGKLRERERETETTRVLTQHKHSQRSPLEEGAGSEAGDGGGGRESDRSKFFCFCSWIGLDWFGLVDRSVYLGGCMCMVIGDEGATYIHI